MPDPLESPTPDRLSPFASSFNTADTALSLLRDARRNQRGLVGGAGLELPDLPPSSRVWIQNNSGADLNPFCIVALGAPLTSIADADNGSYEFRRRPNFSATTPTATTDAFAILDEPAPYVAGGNSPLARAVVQGVIPVDVNVTDTSHGYATPTASDNTKLTSATSGPARILYKPSGTGTKRCVVKLDETGAQPLTDIATLMTDYAITGTDSDAGLSLTIPSAGTYMVFGSVAVSMRDTNLTSNGAYVRLANNIGNSLNPYYYWFSAEVLNVDIFKIVPIIAKLSFSAADALKIYAFRPQATTTARVLGFAGAFGGSFVTTNLAYLKVG